jgi:hypothetical protein
MTQKKFTFDCISESYTGYSSGQRWNGWEMPYFSKSEVLRFIKNEMFTEDRSTLFCWEGQNLIEIDLDDRESHIVDTIVIDGEKYYRIGNGWMWEVERENQYDQDENTAF